MVRISLSCAPLAAGANEGLANIGRTTQQSEYFTGYMNDLRATTSIARYTSPFSVPTMPFQTF